MKKNRILGIVLAGVMLVGVFAACQPSAPSTPNQTPTNETAPPPTAPTEPTVQPPAVDEVGLGRGIIVATQNEPPTIAPGQHNAVAGSYINLMHFNGLFRTDSFTLEPVEDLVASWEAISDTVFEFTIHEGVLFHNGEEVTAEDIAASWEFVKQWPDARTSRESIVEFEVVGPYTIRVDTEIPNAMLFADLTHHSNMVMPKSLIDAGHDFVEQPIGTGPFVFEEWRRGDSLTSSAWESYFDRDRAARVESVTWRTIPEGASRTIALETGEIDYNQYVSFEDIARLEAHSDIDVVRVTGTSHNVMYINHERPQFENIHARRAIDMAVDKEALSIVGFNGFAIPTWSQAPIIFQGSTDVGANSYDPDGARALLAEHNIDPASLDFTVIASNEERRRMGEVMQANLAEIGITVTVEMNDLATTLERTIGGDYEAGYGGFNSATFLGYVRGTFHINGIDASNRSRGRHQEMSDLIDQALATPDANLRIPMFEQINIMANEFVLSIPTHQAMVVKAFNSNLAVPETPATGALNLNMMFWK